MTPTTRRVPRTDTLPPYIYHESFGDPAAVGGYAPADHGDPAQYDARYMPDEVTRDHAKRMHHAAHRARAARTSAAAAKWNAVYLDYRDRIVLGNSKLVYRAVRRQMTGAGHPDDLIGECHIVLIQAVAAFNPWLEIRFSTYAFTCLVRALARLAQRRAGDRLAKALSLDALPNGGPGEEPDTDPSLHPSFPRLDEYLRADHPLLTDREKQIISERFGLADGTPTPTLENVGRVVGLSKERVRQVQASALDKLRRALAPAV